MTDRPLLSVATPARGMKGVETVSRFLGVEMLMTGACSSGGGGVGRNCTRVIVTWLDCPVFPAASTAVARTWLAPRARLTEAENNPPFTGTGAWATPFTLGVMEARTETLSVAVPCMPIESVETVGLPVGEVMARVGGRLSRGV